eukprot:11292636-Heterocapsa_arctica.AAC.1
MQYLDIFWKEELAEKDMKSTIWIIDMSTGRLGAEKYSYYNDLGHEGLEGCCDMTETTTRSST